MLKLPSGKAFVAILGGATLWVAMAADAQVIYRCEKDGQNIISDKPCPKKGLQGQDVDPTRPPDKQKAEDAPLILDDPSATAVPVETAGVSLTGAGEACRRYHAALMSGNTTSLKQVLVGDKVAEYAELSPASLSALAKVMPTSIEVGRIDGDPNSGRAVVQMRATGGRNAHGTCIATVEHGEWKVYRQDW